jgi:hypothetical protein
MPDFFQPPVKSPRFPNVPPDDFHMLRHLIGEGEVPERVLRIIGNIDDGVPSVFGQVFREFEPALDTAATCGRPVVSDDEDTAEMFREFHVAQT